MSFDGPENQLIPKPTVSLSTSSGDSVTLGSLLLFPSCCRWCRIQGPKNGPRILERVVLYYPRHIMFGRLVQIDECFSNASIFEIRFSLLQSWSFPWSVNPVKPIFQELLPQFFNEQRSKHISAVFLHKLYFYWDMHVLYMDMEWYVIGTENWLLVFSWVNHSKSAKIGTHSDFSNDPKGPWSCNTANMDLLVKHVTTHLTKCCQESFNYLNSGTLNCCGWKANTSTVLRWVFRILWKISLWTGILPQADRSQHGSTELTVYWDAKRSHQIR